MKEKTLALIAAIALAGCTADLPQQPTPTIADQTQTRGATAAQLADAAKTGIIPPTFTKAERQTVAWLRGE